MLVQNKILKALCLILMIVFFSEAIEEDIQEMKTLLQKAEAELEEELQNDMKDGATSQRFSRKKVTVVSRAMAERNALYRKAKSLLEEQNDKNDATIDELISVEMRSSKKKSHNLFPGGYVGKTSRISIEDSVCNNIKPVCNASDIFRSIDGKCNNLKNPLWGSKTVSMRRILPSISNLYKIDQYYSLALVGLPCEDDIRFARFCPGWKGKCKGTQGYFMSKYCRKTCGECGGNNFTLSSVDYFGKQNQTCRCKSKCVSSAQVSLPGSRLVSHTFHIDDNIPSDMHVTHMHTQWGQFLDHDITLTPEEEIHDCCTTRNVSHLSSQCFPIHVDKTDSFYFNLTVNRNVSCLEFSRSVPFCEEHLNSTNREQFNDITAFVDASNVYGSDESTMKSLRTNDGSGKLKLDGENLLPRQNESNAASQRFAGDVRALEMPGLATMHTLFVREHNRLVDLLKAKSPKMSGDDLFQHARRLVIAEMQNIVYSEFLPITLGKDMAKKYGLLPKKSSKYDASVDPSIMNSFATSAYRYGHAMIQGFIDFVKFDLSGKTTYQLRENFFNTGKYEEQNGVGMEHILQGLVTQRSRKRDRFVSEELTNHLFAAKGHNHGTDLVARNIQRGRDHGLPGYAAFYEKLISQKDHMDCWDHRPKTIGKKNWDLLKTIYQHPHHIDLFVGGLAEDAMKGAIVGPLFGKILALQFKYLKDGDRFFFTHDQTNKEAKIPDSVVDSLLKRKLSDIICDNTKNMQFVPTNAFLIQSKTNPYKNCNSTKINKIDVNGLFGKKTAGIKLAAQNVQPDSQNGGKAGQHTIQNGEGKQASGNQGKTDCEDLWPGPCPILAGTGYCTSNCLLGSWTSSGCKKSCGKC